MKRTEFQLASERSALAVGVKRVLSYVEPLRLDPHTLFDIRLSAQEALVNAMRHGNRWQPQRTVRVGLHYAQGRLQIKVKDEGEGFNTLRRPNPTRGRALAEPGRRGLFLIQRMMDEVAFNRKGNEIRMVKVVRGQRNGD